MSRPQTIAEFLDLAQKSGVVEPGELEPFFEDLSPAELGAPPGPFAEELVKGGLLTYFHAEQLLLGKHRGFTIGKYRILERLGSGGMAFVYLCEHRMLGQRVAIKMLPTSLQDPSLFKRFLREARAGALLQHPNIVRAHDLDEENRVHFLVMDFVDGVLLHDLVVKHGPLEIAQAAHYFKQVAAGLQCAHDAGLVHRDIKPGNLIIDRAGTVKILDLGLAKVFGEGEVLTTGVLGTPDYVAPEQALDSHAVDARADIYGLGCTLYFALTGTAPFPEGTVAQKLLWHQNRPLLPVKSLRPEVPAELAAVVEKMTRKVPAERYQTATEAGEALTPWATGPVPPPPAIENPRLSLAARSTGTGTSLSVRSQTTPLPHPQSAEAPRTPLPETPKEEEEA